MQAWLQAGWKIKIPVLSLQNEKSRDFDYQFDIFSELLLTFWN